MAHQRRLAVIGRAQPAHRRHQHPDITRGRAHRQPRQPFRNRGENLGIGTGRVLPVKDLIPHRDKFIGAGLVGFLLAKHFAGIGIAGGIGVGLHMHLHDRHREIGPQHHLALQRVRCEIGTCADILAVKIKQSPGRLQHIRLDHLRAFGGKEITQTARFGQCGG